MIQTPIPPARGTDNTGTRICVFPWNCYGQEKILDQTVPFKEGIKTEETKREENETDQRERVSSTQFSSK